MKTTIIKNGVIFIFLTALISSCSKEEVLNNCQINKISILSFPEQTSTGEDWDIFTSYPDIFVRVRYIGQFLYESTYYDECQNVNAYNFVEGLPVYLEDINAVYSLIMYDYDSTSEDEEMASVDFKLSDYEGSSEVILNDPSGVMSVKLNLQWNYTKE
jgi:hypothetical protein